MTERICAVFNVTSRYPDEAIDLENSKLQDYMNSFNPAHLVFKDGVVPTKFNIRRLSPSALSAVKQAAMTKGAGVAMTYSVTLGLISITSPDGSVYAPETTTSKVENRDVVAHKDPVAVSDYLVDTYGYDILAELSNAVMRVSEMPLHLSPFLPKAV